MVGSVIKLSGNGDWGTAFCVERADKTVFFTAFHVVRNIDAANAVIDICDQFSPVSSVNVRALKLYPDCDVATFECDFPASPWPESSGLYKDQAVEVLGYLRTGSGAPQCGDYTSRTGKASIMGKTEGCRLYRHNIHLNMHTGHLHGMSGGPVLKHHEGRRVVCAIFNGAPLDRGGPPFTATVMP